MASVMIGAGWEDGVTLPHRRKERRGKDGRMFFGLCLVKLLFHSALAMRAVKAAATGLAQAADRALALRAGFACAVINGAVKLEAAGPTVAVHIVTNAAAAGGNRILQGGADGFGESLAAWSGKASGGAQRGNASKEQAF